MTEPTTAAGQRVEPVDTLAEVIDKVMPVLIDLDPDWQSRWSTAALVLHELEERGYVLARPLDAAAFAYPRRVRP